VVRPPEEKQPSKALSAFQGGGEKSFDRGGGKEGSQKTSTVSEEKKKKRAIVVMEKGEESASVANRDNTRGRKKKKLQPHKKERTRPQWGRGAKEKKSAGNKGRAGPRFRIKSRGKKGIELSTGGEQHVPRGHAFSGRKKGKEPWPVQRRIHGLLSLHGKKKKGKRVYSISSGEKERGGEKKGRASNAKPRRKKKKKKGQKRPAIPPR